MNDQQTPDPHQNRQHPHSPGQDPLGSGLSRQREHWQEDPSDAATDAADAADDSTGADSPDDSADHSGDAQTDAAHGEQADAAGSDAASEQADAERAADARAAEEAASAAGEATGERTTPGDDAPLGGSETTEEQLTADTEVERDTLKSLDPDDSPA